MRRLSLSVLLVVLVAVALPAVADSHTFRARDAAHQPLLSGGTLSKRGTENSDFVRIPADGVYEIAVRASASARDGIWPQFGIVVDGFAISLHTVTSEQAAVFSARVALDAGVWAIGAQMMNDSLGFLNRSTLRLEDYTITPVDGGGTPQKANGEAWFADAQARDAAVLARADAAIAQHRIGAATLVVVDGEGAPLPDAAVTVELKQHAFLFGASIAGFRQYGNAARDEAYLKRFEALFNYATVPLYWRYLEPSKGRRDYPRVDAMVDWCAARGIAMKGHPLLWDSEHGYPTWSGGQPDAATQRAHVEDLLGRYKDRIQYWEVVNEPANHPGVKMMPAHGWARAAAPDAVLVVNEYGPFYNGHPPFRALLEDAKKAGTPFDAVGIQAHAPPDMAFPLARVWRILDDYATLGVPIHITEFIPPSSGGAISGAVWRGQWSEASQAAYAEDLYRVLFAHPAVAAISWWDFSDQGAWIPHGGLLRADATPKPAYDRLHRLIKETWHTRAEGATDAAGQFPLRGFHGTYTVRVEHGGKTTEREVALLPGGDATVRVVL